MFKIEMLPAGHGDSLLVSYGEPDSPHYVLIDGGPYYAYRNKRFVERKTLSTRVKRLVDGGGRLELLVITHVDADHIEAVVRLLGNRPSGLDIQDVWFNAWKHLAPSPEDLLGPVQGEMLSALIQREGLPWNVAFGCEAVAVKPGEVSPPVTLPGGLQLTLLSPTPVELAGLRGTWEEALCKEGLDPDSPEEALARLKVSRLKPDDYLGERRPDVDMLAEEPFESDDSPANGSSIAFIAEFEGKRCLFAGDAHPAVLETSVRRLLDERGESRLHLDAFKISHHGSKGNLSPDLLGLLACERYLVSTNGSYFDHPDEEAIARIVVHGGGGPVLCFNYRSEENAVWDDAVLKDEYGYHTIYPDEEHQGLIAEL
jgi:beta-lactamase superfamily II metal-dependent hydrolase